MSEEQRQKLKYGKIPVLSANEMEIISLSSSATAKCGWNLEQHLNDAGDYMIMTWTYIECGGGSEGGFSFDLGYGSNSSGSSEIGSSSNSSGGGILTSPVDSHHGGGGGAPQTFPDTPCGRIQKETSSNAYKQKFKGINKPSSFNLSRESGFVEKIENGVKQYVNATPLGNTSMNMLSGSINYTHVHTNIIVTNENGEEFDRVVKISSPADVLALITTCQNSHLNANSNPRCFWSYDFK